MFIKNGSCIETFSGCARVFAKRISGHMHCLKTLHKVIFICSVRTTKIENEDTRVIKQIRSKTKTTKQTKHTFV